MRSPSTNIRLAVAVLAIPALLPVAALSAELAVQVTGVASRQGEVGCALHASGAEFPTSNVRSTNAWLPADPRGVVCRFADVKPGVYAIAVSHDLNGNRKTDTNFLGIPTEAWGVSNNVRPALRAPTFDEAKFEVKAVGTTTISVRLQ